MAIGQQKAQIWQELEEMKTSFPSWLKASKNEALVQLRQASFRQFLHSWTDVSAILTADYLIYKFQLILMTFYATHDIRGRFWYVTNVGRDLGLPFSQE